MSRLLNSEKLLMVKTIKIDTTPIKFNFTGTVQEYVIPKGVSLISVDCVGGAGYCKISSIAGKGGRVQCSLNVSGLSKLFIYVGGMGKSNNDGGWNGGGAGAPCANNYTGGGGGGGSDIRTILGDLNSRLICAGGGGGCVDWADYYKAGHGGGLTGGNGLFVSASAISGAGGSQTAGGLCYWKDSTIPTSQGGFGLGGKCDKSLGGGGGGAGYYGGGGGPGGGGGSSYTHPSLCSDVIHTQGYGQATSNGWIILTPQG